MVDRAARRDTMRAAMSQAEYPNVTAVAKANVYFDGKVVSHTIKLADGVKKTLGLIYAGEFHFGTDAPGPRANEDRSWMNEGRMRWHDEEEASDPDA